MLLCSRLSFSSKAIEEIFLFLNFLDVFNYPHFYCCFMYCRALTTRVPKIKASGPHSFFLYFCIYPYPLSSPFLYFCIYSYSLLSAFPLHVAYVFFELYRDVTACILYSLFVWKPIFLGVLLALGSLPHISLKGMGCCACLIT